METIVLYCSDLGSLEARAVSAVFSMSSIAVAGLHAVAAVSMHYNSQFVVQVIPSVWSAATSGRPEGPDHCVHLFPAL